MTNYLSIIEKVSEKLAKPYAVGVGTFFIIGKGNCYVSIHFEEDAIKIEGFVGGATLVLNSRDLSDFMFRLKKLSSVNPTAINTKTEISPSAELSSEFYRIFPRIQYGIYPYPEWSDEEVAGFLEDTYNVLIEIGKIVNEFRARDKGFESLEKLWDKVVSSVDKNEKGKLLEEFFALVIGRDENFVVAEKNLRTESEELDIVVENNGMTQFYSQLRCPIILFECKNWSSRIGSKEIRDFAQKIQNRPRNLCSVGILVTMSELTTEAFTELVGYRGKDFLIGLLERKDIETILRKRIPFGSYLKDTVRKAGLR